MASRDVVKASCSVRLWVNRVSVVVDMDAGGVVPEVCVPVVWEVKSSSRID